MADSFDNKMTGLSRQPVSATSRWKAYGKIGIILGSARSDGHTAQIAAQISSRLGANLIDLKEYQIGHYDYQHGYKNDDFLNLIRNEIIEMDTLILATPVYWYSMSGRMKVFLDRFTDLLKIEKDLGRQLRDKSLAVFTTSNGDNLGADFWHPFVKTANYLGMHYLANAHFFEGDIAKPDLEVDFVNDLLTARANL